MPLVQAILLMQVLYCFATFVFSKKVIVIELLVVCYFRCGKYMLLS